MEGHKTVTMQSHLDMVPQKNSSVKHDFLTDPIDAYIDGDWVKARSTAVRCATLSRVKLFAVITIPPGDNVEALWELVSDYQEMYRYEYKGIEHNINFTAEMTDMPATLIPEEIQDDLINAIEGCQNGVISMLVDFPGTVESSTNLAIVKSSNEMIEIQILVRSSSESRKEAVCSSLESIFSLAGAKVEYSDGYGGWQPNIDSPILKIMQQAYLDLYGKKPEAKVMHAGLECGIIQESYPDMDMISIGPDLQHPHSPDERVSIPSVARTWDFIVTTLARI